MYDEHYGLTGRPFQLTPDPRFWFDTATHRKAMAYLGYGLSQGEGFIVITGDPGTGKTTLVGHLMATVDPERLHVVQLVTTQIEASDLLRMVARGMGVDAVGLTKAELLSAIERGLHRMARDGKRTLLIVDEAQSLPVESLEELRMLSNFQAGGYPLLQIFLLGQPEFRLLLQASDGLEQLRQRVIAMHHLEPMGVEELEAYLIHRLSVVGWRGNPRFSPEAVAAIHRWSGGIPRRVNQLASRVMLFGAMEQVAEFAGDDVEAVIADIDGDMKSALAPAAVREPAPFWQPPQPEIEEAVPFVEPEPAPTAADPVEQTAEWDEGDIDPLPISVRDEAPAAPEPIHAPFAARDDAAAHTPFDLREEAEDAEPVQSAVPHSWLEPEPADEEPAIDAPRAIEAPFAWRDEVEPVENEIEDEPLTLVAPDFDEVPEAVALAEPQPEPEPVAEPIAETPEIEPEPVAPAPVAADEGVARQLAMIEARLQEQDAALRRVLTLLVDWVEGEGGRRPDLDDLRDHAA